MKNAIRPIGIITLSIFGFLVIVSFYTDKSELEYSGKEMHTKVLEAEYNLSIEEALQKSNGKLVDIRDSKAFRFDPREDAVNIPLADILNEDYASFFENEKVKVLISDDPADVYQAWMLLTQLGYENLFVTTVKKEVEKTEKPKIPTGPRKVIAGGH